MPAKFQHRNSLFGDVVSTVFSLNRGLFEPVLTGLVLTAAIFLPRQIRLLLPALLQQLIENRAFLSSLKVLFSVGALFKANYLLSDLVLNNFQNAVWEEGKEIVLITGGTGGIGGALAVKLSTSAAKVIVFDLNPPKTPLPSNVYFYQVDITSEEQVHSAAEDIRKIHGDPTILVNNAAVAPAKFLLEESVDQIRNTFGVNAIAHFIMVKEFLPAMIKRNHGHIVTISSSACYVVMLHNIDYSCTKASSMALHEGLACELKIVYGADKVRTTIVHPYWTRTSMIKSVANAPNLQGTILEPETVAEAIKKQLLSGKGGQLFIPNHMGLLSSIRGWPSWAQTTLRMYFGRKLIKSAKLL